jgi:ABC-type multidrug transport system ATPase subunit
MIELKNVTKRYESLTAVDDVSFSVKTGEYFALLGPNGAGKTTTDALAISWGIEEEISALQDETVKRNNKT